MTNDKKEVPSTGRKIIDGLNEAVAHADGLEDVVLKKKWAGRKVGATVRVDPVRAKWLIDHGFGASAEAETKKRSK